MKAAFWGFLLALAVTSIATAEERITDFSSEITVEKSGDLIVTETIKVVAEGNRINHGIYRDFPTLYHDTLGLNRQVAFDVLTVWRDGQSEPWHLGDRDNGTRVYIGSSSTRVLNGPHVYVLRYRTNRQLVQKPGFDELYWNVTGNQWAFPIDHAEAKVTLPTGAVISEINAYVGYAGERGQQWRAQPAGQWNAVLATTRTLEPEEGFTISVKWQKGLVDANANVETLRDMALDNHGIALALVGLAIVFVYYLGAWICIGRDPPRGVIIPLYQPPKDFTPAAVRYLDGMGKFDNKSFAATVIDLAVKGALRIQRHSDKSYTLERKDGADGLGLPQRQFYRALMNSREKLDLDNSECASFQAARQKLLQSLRSEIEKRYFFRNFGWWVAGLILSLLPALYALNDSRNLSSAVFMTFWLAIWSVGVIGLISGAASGFRSRKFLATLPLLLFAIPFTGAWFVGAFMLMKETSPWVAGVFVFGFGINATFYHLLKAPTQEGRRVMDEIEGFRRYLSIGEKDRLNLENPPERTPEHYELFLPYALALDVEQKWSRQFADVLEAAQYAPDWYQGGGTFDLTTNNFSSSLGGAFTGAIASSSTSPSSSSGGGGGGGSSGGGGGGGGGGGW